MEVNEKEAIEKEYSSFMKLKFGKISKILWNNYNSSMKRKTSNRNSFLNKEMLSFQTSLNNLYWEIMWQIISKLTAELQETLLIEFMFCMVKNVAV